MAIRRFDGGRKLGRIFAVAASTCLLTASQAALCADEAGSLDSMWVDGDSQGAAAQPAPRMQAPSEPPIGAPSAAPAATTQEDNASPSWTDREDSSPRLDVKKTGDTVSAPMVSLEEFKNSTFVSKAGWPGVGPFKQAGDDPTELVDSNENRLKVNLQSGQVTRVEMVMAPPKTKTARNILDLEMPVDFLLEALSIKPKRIVDLNTQLEKNKEALFSPDPTQLSLTAGRYLVNIDKKKANSGFEYLVSVNSMDASQQVIREHSAADPAPVTAVQPDATTDAPPVVKTPTGSKPIGTTRPATPGKTALAAKPVTAKPTTATPTAGSSTATTTTSTEDNPDAPDAVPSSGDSRKDQFADAIRSWQSIKRAAVKSRQTEELQKVLAGRALIRQTDAVKWLVNNHKYYEMVPRGVTVEKYSELTPTKYLVSAQVKEFSKFIDEPSGQVIKEGEDTYKVNYTIEKIGGRWFITDSALPNVAKPAVKPPTR